MTTPAADDYAYIRQRALALKRGCTCLYHRDAAGEVDHVETDGFCVLHGAPVDTIVWGFEPADPDGTLAA